MYHKIIIMVLLLFPGLLRAQQETECNPMSETMIASGEANFYYGSVSNAVTTTRVSDYTVGQSVTGQAYSSSGILSGGFWGRLLAPTSAPLVKASQGEYPDRIELSWTLDPLSPRPSSGFTVRRNGSLLAQLDRSTVNFIDFNVQAGELYEYEVVGINAFGEGYPGGNVGFVNPNGVVTGKVVTVTQNPVKDVTVTLTPTISYALRFDGVDDHLCVSYQDHLPENAFTLSAWVKIGDGNDRSGIIDLGSDLNKNFWIQTTASDQGKGVIVGVGNGQVYEINHTFSNNPDDWHHIAFTFAGGLAILYIDGVFAEAIEANFATEAALFNIGSRRGTGYYNGLIDDVRIFNRMLSQTEILAYQSISVSRNTEGLVAYWKFDEGMGDKVFDISENSFDADIHGAVFDSDNPGVKNGGISDEAGIYVIEGVNYSSTQSFQAKPAKKFYSNYALEFNPVFGSRAKLTQFDLPDSTSTIELIVNPFSKSRRQTLLYHESGQLEWYIENNHYFIKTEGDPFDLGIVEMGYQLLSLQVNRTAGTLSFYKNGELVLEDVPVALNTDFSQGHWYVGSNDNDNSPSTLLGLIDEFALFDTLLSVQQMQLHASPNSSGIDPGSTDLMVYFAFSEATGTEVRDAGEYMTGFGQLEGLQFTPQTLQQEEEGHLFSPDTRVVNLNNSNTAIGEIDFTDNSTVPIAGVVRYADTDCYASNTTLLVNGEDFIPPIKTDQNGRFVADFEPGSTVRLEPVREGQNFLPAQFEARNLQTPIAGVLFQNETKRTITGQVAGGLCRKSIIPDSDEGAVQVKVRTLNGCYEEVITIDNPSGKFTFSNVPPDSVSIFVLSHPVNKIQEYFQDQGGYTLDMRFAEVDTVDFVYRAGIELELSELVDTNALGDYMLEMTQPAQLRIKVLEPYFDGVCYLDTAEIFITNQIADLEDEIDTLMTGGILDHKFTAGGPNIIPPYKKLLQVSARRDSSSNLVARSIEAVVLGRRPRQTQFATTSPDVPLLILRDPPGDGSYAYIEQGQTNCTSLSVSASVGFDSDINLVTSLGPDISIEAGIGAGVSIDFDNTLDIGVGASLDFNAFSSATGELCLTTTETISTSDEDLVVGGAMGGDVFMGGAWNLIYGLTDELSYNDSTQTYILDNGLWVFPEGFETTFLYTERQIRDIVIPDLEQIGDTISVQAWRDMLHLNDTQKANASFQKNISFASGTVFEESMTTEQSLEASVGTELTTRVYASLANGATVNGIGVVQEVELGITTSRSIELGSVENTSRTVGYVLADDDAFDNFSVDIKRDKVYQVPVFDLKAGQTSCPHESPQTTQRREEVQLTSNQLVATNINAEDAAVFELTLGNTAPSDDIGFYTLALVPESNPDGAALVVNGDGLLADGQVFSIPPGESVSVTLSIERGPVAYTYEDIRVALYSECEFERAIGLGMARADIDPAFYKEISLDIQFLEPCSEVAIGAPMENWVITPQDSNILSITLNGYDKGDPDLELIRVQYRPTMGDGSWINIAEIPKAELGDNFEVSSWDLSALNDGSYEIRAVTKCINADLNPGYSKIIKGRKETQPPQLFGTPQPADGVLSPGDDISVMFTKRINCNLTQAAGIGSNIFNNNVGLYDATTGALVDAVITCNEDEIKIVPNVANQFIENKNLRVRVEDVEDLFGNTISQPIVWEFLVNRSTLFWEGGDINTVAMEGESVTVTRNIRNQGGFSASFNLEDIPDWVDVFPTAGLIAPGAFETITFEFPADLVGGLFNGTLRMETSEGNEPLNIDLRVACPPPAWNINPADYSYSMNLALQLNIEGVLSTDKLDIVGAFIDGQLRGYAKVEAVPELNTHMAFLTVYSNAPNGQTVEFRVWDASACLVYGPVAQSFPFVADSFVGSLQNPEVLTTNNLVLRQIPIYPGWNWISYNVNLPDPSINAALGSLSNPAGATIKGQTAFSQYFAEATTWAGSLNTLSHETMYQYQSTVFDSILLAGQPIDPSASPLALQAGWNWIGYLPQQGMGVNEALASLSPLNGDLIKGQTGFALYDAGAGWLGSLDFMSFPRGYLLYLSNPGTLTYPANFTGGGTAQYRGPAIAERSGALGHYWEVDPFAFEYTMNLVAVVASEEVDNCLSADHEIAAFVGEEVRGSGKPVYIEALDAYLLFLTIYSNEQGGEPITFKMYDAVAETETGLNESYVFIANRLEGSIEAPEVLTFSTPVSAREERRRLDGFKVFPNPAKEEVFFEFVLSEPGPVQLLITDALGRQIGRVEAEAEAGANLLNWQAGQWPRGLYTVTLLHGQKAVSKLLELR
jgi:hypothetical protein